jgi:hypothetical protein
MLWPVLLACLLDVQFLIVINSPIILHLCPGHVLDFAVVVSLMDLA